MYLKLVCTSVYSEHEKEERGAKTGGKHKLHATRTSQVRLKSSSDFIRATVQHARRLYVATRE
jgi:hypothetical protein